MASTIVLGCSLNTITFSPGAGTYEFANNPVTGQGWTPTAAIPTSTLSGGAPFAVESLTAYQSYGSITETIPIQIKGATHDAIIASLQALRYVLSYCTENRPGALVYQPDGATKAVDFLVWGGSVQEDYRFVNDEAGRGVLRAQMTIRRGVWGVRSSSSTVAINSGTIGNIPSGAPSNLISMTGLAGDQIYVGQPITLRLASAVSGIFASAGIQRAYLATLLTNTARTNVATAMTTSSTSGITVSTADYSGLNFAHRMTFRVCGRITSPSSNLEVRVSVVYGSAAAGSGATLYTSPWIAPGTSTTYVDFGWFRYPAHSDFAGAGSIRLVCQARSTNGAAVSGTWADVERLMYATFCRITSTISLTAPTLRIRTANSYSAVSGNAGLILPSPYVVFEDSGGVVLDIPEVRGTLPIALENGYFMATALTGGVHDSTDTGSYNLDHMPIYTTLIGNG